MTQLNAENYQNLAQLVLEAMPSASTGLAKQKEQFCLKLLFRIHSGYLGASSGFDLWRSQFNELVKNKYFLREQLSEHFALISHKLEVAQAMSVVQSGLELVESEEHLSAQYAANAGFLKNILIAWGRVLQAKPSS